MINRRQFMLAASAAAVGSLPRAARGQVADATKEPQPNRQAQKQLMYVGSQAAFTRSENGLAFLKRHGVDHVDGGQPKYVPGTGWALDEILAAQERCARHRISLDMFHLPLSSAGIDKVPMPNILLGKSPQRDREIEDLCRIISMAKKLGITGLNYNLTILPILRAARKPGRGGSSYSSWVLAEAPKDQPLTKAGPVPLDVFWDRITYFLERVIPVATEHKIKMACHIADPGTVPGYRGVDRALGTIEGLKRFVETCPSDYHGFNFCVGSCAEMLKEPAREILEVVRYFGQRKKIFNVHLRNIRGRRDSFQEVYHDEGDVDMYEVVRILKETQYHGMVMPDHVPRHRDDAERFQGYAFAFGYIKGLIQAAYSTS